jgi:hypothetical protein
MSQIEVSMLDAQRRLRANARRPVTHAAEELGERAWLATQQLLARLRVDRERRPAAGVARVIGHIRRHCSRDAYWPVEYGW